MEFMQLGECDLLERTTVLPNGILQKILSTDKAVYVGGTAQSNDSARSTPSSHSPKMMVVIILPGGDELASFCCRRALRG